MLSEAEELRFCTGDREGDAVWGPPCTIGLTKQIDKKIVLQLLVGRLWVFLIGLKILRFLFYFVSLEADEIDSEDSTEPPHKRLCLSSEDDQSIDGSTPCISVVALPRKSLCVQNRGPF